MQRIILLLITLTTFANICYASFPIIENSSSDILNTISFQIADEEEEEEDGIKWGLFILVLSALGFGAFFLIRAWWRAWKDDTRWVKISTYILLGLLLLLLIIVVLDNTVGLVYNMQ